MAKGKKADTTQEKSTIGSGGSKLAYKKSMRKQQSEHDRSEALKAEGYTPKKATEDEDRCGRCNRPSAAIRHGGDLCNRCLRRNDPAKSRARQGTRDLAKTHMVSPLAAALAAKATTVASTTPL